ncbi:MAG TPA: TonB-dependent receptor [Verrucomicrobiae bacterium]|nr:TonB-dependent receptor [Verrucomicrobiae bacterium]
MKPEIKAGTQESFGTHQKAIRINLDPSKYGTFAEIGAGQEVARWFFRVGGASGTIAKTISAYDMQVSDAIYGKCERYVSRQRLLTMLDHEYSLLQERLSAKRGADTRFFAFAETVAAQGYIRRDECHGWMGVRFQTEPEVEFSQVIIHIRMLDAENLQQQEALGIAGVNLVYGAMYLRDDVEVLVKSLLDDLTSDRIEVDMIKFSGPAFDKVDNRLMALKLVQHGLTKAAMFTADGEVVNAAETLHKKAILVERGSFRPVTNVTLDMLRSAQAQFVQEPGVQGEEVLVLMEMTLRNLIDGGEINHQDFLDRVDILSTQGKMVLISNYGSFHRLATFLFRYTKKRIGIVMGVPTLREIFDEKYYTDLEGGILESFGRLFKNDLKLYVYPLLEPATKALITAANLRVESHLQHLYDYLIQNRSIESLRDVRKECLPIFSRDVLEQIKAGRREWEEMVPPEVAQIIKERRLLGCQPS